MKNEERIEGVIVCGQPTDEELAGLPGRGITTLVNLRPPEELEEPEGPKVPAGVTYVEIPFNRATFGPEHVARMHEVLDKAQGQVVVHCQGGTRAALVVGIAKAEKAGDGAEGALRRMRESDYDVTGTPYEMLTRRHFGE